jgi:PAS domain S-box-containing protein
MKGRDARQPEWSPVQDPPIKTPDGLYPPGRTDLFMLAAVLMGVVAALVGAGHLVAWLGGYLTGQGLTAIIMKTNAALCLTLVGVGVMLLVPPQARQVRRWIVWSCAALALLTGLLTFVENLSGWDFGIDQLLATETPGALAVTSPNRMGTPASLSFTLIGAALLLLTRRDYRRVWLAQVLALAVCLIALLPTIGFLYEAERFYGIARYTAIAWPTAVSLLLVGVGLLCARPAAGLMAQITINDPGGVTLRRLLPSLVILPLLLGWLRLAGERTGVFDAATGTGMMMVTFIILFSALAYHAARRASRSAQILKESEDRFRVAQELSPDGFVILRPVRDNTGLVTDFLWIYENDAAARMNDTNPKEVCGKRMSEVLPHHDKSPFHEAYKEVAETGEVRVVEEAFYDQDTFRQRRCFRVAAVPTSGGDVAGLVQDVTERKQAEEALQESEARLHTTVENLAEAVIVSDPLGNVLNWNQTGATMFGYENPEQGRMPLARFAETYEVADLDGTVLPLEQWPLSRILRGDRLQGSEIRLRRFDSDWQRILSLSGNLVRDRDGHPLLAVVSANDITERKRAEETMKWYASRDEVLSHTAARLLESTDPEGLIEDLCRQVMGFLDCHVFFNFLIDERSGRPHLNACAGIPVDEVGRIEWLERGEAVRNCVARDKERIIAEDIQNTPDPRTEPVKSYGIQAYCCHPLQIQSRLIGTLSFGTRSRPRFRVEEIEVMKNVADLVAMAMHRIEIEKTLRDLNATLESKVAARTTELQDRAEQLQKLTLELTQAEERERRRIAVILHEDLQQQIAGARFHLNLLRSGAREDRQQTHVDKVDSILTEAIATSRNLSCDLSPAALHLNDLAELLHWLVDRVREQQGLDVCATLRGNMTLHSEALAIFLFRAAQEMLFNVVKHAGVKEAAIRARRFGRYVCLSVSDQGRGFDPGELKRTSGIGLLSIRERTEFLGGRMRGRSAHGRGSRFTLIVPDGPGAQSRPATSQVADRHAVPSLISAAPAAEALPIQREVKQPS